MGYYYKILQKHVGVERRFFVKVDIIRIAAIHLFVLECLITCVSLVLG